MWRRAAVGVMGILMATSVIATPVFRTILPNGLILVVKPDHRAPVVATTVWYKVGGSYEHNGKTGISHALEHMMFQGTKSVKPGEFAQRITSNGGELNAMTGRDYTVYHELIGKKYLPLCFTLESDRMHNLQISEAKFKKEIEVVKEERHMRVDDNPQSRTDERFDAMAFVNSPYHHPVIGWMTDLNHLNANDLRAWYKAWYAPNNAVVVVVGDVKPTAVLALAKKTFGRVPAHSLPTLAPRDEVLPLGMRQLDVTLPAKSPWLEMGYFVPTLKTASAPWKAYALQLLAGVLSAGESSRLPSELVRQQQSAVTASAGYSLFSLHGTLFMLTAIPGAGQSLLQLEKNIRALLHDLTQTPVTKKELDRVKAQVIASLIYKNDSLMSQAYWLGGFEMIGIPATKENTYITALKSVTPLQVKALAREVFVKNNLSVGMLEPLGAQS